MAPAGTGTRTALVQIDATCGRVPPMLLNLKAVVVGRQALSTMPQRQCAVDELYESSGTVKRSKVFSSLAAPRIEHIRQPGARRGRNAARLPLGGRCYGLDSNQFRRG